MRPSAAAATRELRSRQALLVGPAQIVQLDAFVELLAARDLHGEARRETGILGGAEVLERPDDELNRRRTGVPRNGRRPVRASWKIPRREEVRRRVRWPPLGRRIEQPLAEGPTARPPAPPSTGSGAVYGSVPRNTARVIVRNPPSSAAPSPRPLARQRSGIPTVPSSPTMTFAGFSPQRGIPGAWAAPGRSSSGPVNRDMWPGPPALRSERGEVRQPAASEDCGTGRIIAGYWYRLEVPDGGRCELLSVSPGQCQQLTSSPPRRPPFPAIARTGLPHNSHRTVDLRDHAVHAARRRALGT